MAGLITAGTGKSIVAAMTAGTAVPVIVGWLWLGEYFMLREDAVAAHSLIHQDADSAHADIANSLEKVTVNWELDKTNSEMAFIEREGIQVDEQREYSRLEFQLEFLTKKSLELGHK